MPNSRSAAEASAIQTREAATRRQQALDLQAANEVGRLRVSIDAFNEVLGCRDVDIYRGLKELGHVQFYKVVKHRLAPMSGTAVINLVERLQELVDKWVVNKLVKPTRLRLLPDGRSSAEVHAAVTAHCRARFRSLADSVPFIGLDQRDFWPVVRPSKLVALDPKTFEQAKARPAEYHFAEPFRAPVAEPAGEDSHYMVLRGFDGATHIVLDREYDMAGLADLIAQIRHRVPEQPLTTARLLATLNDACMEIVLTLTEQEAAALTAAFNEGRLASLGVAAVYQRRINTADLTTRLAVVDSGPINLDDAASVKASCARALRRMRVVRPWRRLRWLFARRPSWSPIAHGLSSSDDRAYTSPDVSRNGWRHLRTDLVTATFLWPLLTTLLLTVTLFGLKGLEPNLQIGLGIATALAIALAGAQPCASVISPLAISGGGIFIGYAFGVCQALVLGRLATLGRSLTLTNIQHDPFAAVVGGVVGLSAPLLRDAISLGTLALFALIVVIIPCAICGTGWLMAQPRRAAGDRERHTVSMARAVVEGFIVGGGGIGCVYGLTVVLGNHFAATDAFMVSSAVVGGVWFGATVLMRTRHLPSLTRVTKAIGFVAAHVLIGWGLCAAAFTMGTGALGLIFLCAATGWFHSTFYTTSFVIADERSGSRAATLATALEGAGGFTAFVIIRLLFGVMH